MHLSPLILIVDLEATCWEGNVPDSEHKQRVEDMEIIEFGCVVAQLDGTVVDSRAFMVQPQIRPQLSAFCTSLTSISQADVSTAPLYQETVGLLDTWLAGREISAWGSWGSYDLQQITVEKQRYHCAPEFLQLPHINIKRRWCADKTSEHRIGIDQALAYHQLPFDGFMHRGIDDALNIARLLPWTELSL